MGMLSALIDDAIDNAPFQGSLRPSSPSRRDVNCPICGTRIDKDDLDSHIFNVHRHGLLLHTADGDSKFRNAIRERQDLTHEQSIDCLEYCLQTLTLYAKGTIDWEEEKRITLRDQSNSSKLKAAFIQLLYLIYSEDIHGELPFRRYEDLKSIYPRLRPLVGAVGVAARTVIEIYFDWYECISTLQGPFFEVATLFQASRSSDMLSTDQKPSVNSRAISICVPNQMIQFIDLASRAVNTSKLDFPEIQNLAIDTSNFYQNCPYIYKQKAFFLASYLNVKFSRIIDLDPYSYAQASLVEVYGLEGAKA